MEPMKTTSAAVEGWAKSVRAGAMAADVLLASVDPPVRDGPRASPPVRDLSPACPPVPAPNCGAAGAVGVGPPGGAADEPLGDADELPEDAVDNGTTAACWWARRASSGWPVATPRRRR